MLCYNMSLFCFWGIPFLFLGNFASDFRYSYYTLHTEADNGIFFDYEGRKPQATITIGWDGDHYFFKLIVDGEERMQSEEREELKAEAQRLGAELEETHTP